MPSQLLTHHAEHNPNLRKMLSKFISSTLLGLAVAKAADQAYIDVPLVGHDATSFLGSIVAADAKATTVAIACPASTDCGLFPKEIIVYGPSTYNIDMSDPNSDFTATMDCSFATSSVVCKETAGGSEANFPGSSTTTYDATEFGNARVSVTAGASLLAAGASGAATDAGSSKAAVSTSAGSSGAAGATPSTTPAARSGSASGSASKTSTAPASASTGAAASNGVMLPGSLVGAFVGAMGARFFL